MTTHDDHDLDFLIRRHLTSEAEARARAAASTDEMARRLRDRLGAAQPKPMRPLLLAAAAATLLVLAGVAGGGFTPDRSHAPSTASPASSDAAASPGPCMTALVPRGGPIADLRTELAAEPLVAWRVDGAVIIGSADGTAERRVELPIPPLTRPTWNSVWSPSGEWLAIEIQFDTYPPGGCAEVLLVGVDGTVFRVGPGLPGVGTRLPAWSPDGAELAYVYVHGYEPSGVPSAEIHVRSLATGVDRVLATIDCLPVGIMAFSPDGRRLALDCYDSLLIIDAATGTTSELAPRQPATLMGWSQDPGGLLIRERTMRVVDAGSGATRRSFDIAWLDEIARAHGIPVSWLDPTNLANEGSSLASDRAALAGLMSAPRCPEGICPGPEGPYEAVGILYVLDTNSGALRTRAFPSLLYVNTVLLTPAGDAMVYSIYGDDPEAGTYLVGLDGGEPQRISDRGDDLIRSTTTNQ